MANHTTDIENGFLDGLEFYSLPSPSFMVIYITISALSVAANILHMTILIFMSKQNRQKHLPQNYVTFLMVLAVTDLLNSTWRLISANDWTQSLMTLYKYYCVLSAVISHSCMVSGISCILLLSVDRIKAFNPERAYSSNGFVKNFAKMLVVAVLSTFIFFGVLAALCWDKGYNVRGLGACRMGSDKVRWLGLITPAIVTVQMIVICTLYGRIFRHTIRMLRMPTLRRNFVARRNAELTRGIGIVVLAKVVAWFPMFLTVILGAMKISSPEFEWFAVVCTILNPILHPLIYGLNNKIYIRFVNDVRKRCMPSNSIKPRGSTANTNTTSDVVAVSVP